jgi:hypothetical protein
VPLDPQRARDQLAVLVRHFGPGKYGGLGRIDAPLELARLVEPSRCFADPGFTCRMAWGRRAKGELRDTRARRMFVSEPGQRMRDVVATHTPVCCVRWTLWIEPAALRKSGVALLRQLAIDAATVAAADHVFVTPWLDYRAKHHSIRTNPNGGTTEQMLGDDPDRGLPGLYWLNLFGPRYVDWLGRDRFAALDATVEPLADGAMLVQFGATPDDAAAMHDRQRAAIPALGDDAFFDLARPDRKLRVPPSDM